MQSSVITYHEDFIELCEHIRQAGIVAFDTEFVSDYSYRPALGLLQFATPDRCVAVDPLEVENLSAWWEIMADDPTCVVVHGGQAEIRFCFQAIGRAPKNLVDIQIAEGFRCRSYPLSYSAIVERVLGQSVDSSQTRTDWIRRPLSADQLQYALEDVEHVLEIWQKQRTWLEKNERIDWAMAECQRIINDVVEDAQTPAWKRLNGIHKLSRRDLLVAQHLAKWREEEAAFRNKPVRRILRDDLLIDLARRKPRNQKQLLATRDMNRPEYRRRLDDILDVIGAACEAPNSELPEKQRRKRSESSSDEQVISKLLSLSLSNVCADLDISQTLVANNKDLAALVRYHRFGDKSDGAPRLLTGWRSEVCGTLLQQVMDGKVGFRVAPKDASTPLVFE